LVRMYHRGLLTRTKGGDHGVRHRLAAITSLRWLVRHARSSILSLLPSANVSFFSAQQRGKVQQVYRLVCVENLRLLTRPRRCDNRLSIPITRLDRLDRYGLGVPLFAAQLREPLQQRKVEADRLIGVDDLRLLARSASGDHGLCVAIAILHSLNGYGLRVLRNGWLHGTNIAQTNLRIEINY
jgi:hypothetical protein